MTRQSLAAAQTTPVSGDVPANIRQHLKMVERAASENVQLMVFPELSLTGYELSLANELAFTARDPRIEPLRDAASQYSMTLLAGAPVRLDTGLHIACFVIRPDRAVEVYTKLYLHSTETGVFQPCSLNPRVEWGDSRAAIAICADTNNPRHMQRAAELEATIYLASVFFTPAGYPSDIERLQRFAARHAMTPVLANYGGDSGGMEAAGGSAIWESNGRPVAKLDGTGAGLVIGTRVGSVWSGQTISVP